MRAPAELGERPALHWAVAGHAYRVSKIQSAKK